MSNKIFRNVVLIFGIVYALGQAPVTAYAQDTIVDITGKDSAAMSIDILDALDTYDTVRVIGSSVADEIIDISIPDSKQIIWQAECMPADRNNYPYMFNLHADPSNNDTAKFVIAEGAKLFHNKEHFTLINDDGIDINMTGGEIVIGNLSERRGDTPSNKFGIDIKGQNADFKITGGFITSYASVPAISLTDGAKAEINSTVKGLQRHPIDNNGFDTVIRCTGKMTDHVKYGKNAAIVAFGFDYGRSHHSQYLEGSARGIKVKGRSSETTAYWRITDNKKIIKYSIGDISGEWDLTELPELEVYSFVGADTVLPTIREYNGEGYGVENLAAIPDFDGSVKVFYLGIEPTTYTVSEEKPVEPGKYLAAFTVNDGHYYGVNSGYSDSLAYFTISKRTVKIKANSKTIKEGENIPTLDYTVEGVLEGENAFTGMPVLTTDAVSGDEAGFYNIKVDLSGLNIDEKYEVVAENAVLTINDASGSEDFQATPSNPSVQNDIIINPDIDSDKRLTISIKPVNTGGINKQHNTVSNSIGSGDGENGNSIKGGIKERTSRKRYGGYACVRRCEVISDSGNNAGMWIMDDKGWWFKNIDGSYPKNGWRLLSYNNSLDWYYFDSEGYMATGWMEIAGKWYYLYEETANGHIKGAMAKDTLIGSYKVGSDGAWIK